MRKNKLIIYIIDEQLNKIIDKRKFINSENYQDKFLSFIKKFIQEPNKKVIIKSL